jgi:hypothetical protein
VGLQELLVKMVHQSYVDLVVEVEVLVQLQLVELVETY